MLLFFWLEGLCAGTWGNRTRPRRSRGAGQEKTECISIHLASLGKIDCRLFDNRIVVSNWPLGALRVRSKVWNWSGVTKSWHVALLRKEWSVPGLSEARTSAL